VKVALSLAVRPAEGGSTLTFTGTASADGRISDLPAAEVTAATTRLLNRFAEHLATGPAPGTSAPAAAADSEGRAADGPSPSKKPPVTETPPMAEEAPGTPATPGIPEASEGPSSSEELPSVDEVTDEAADEVADETEADTEASPSSHVPFAEGDFVGGFEDDGTLPPGAPAEAAHARRTMIGRSAEEVDHAPPRGRYAPVPAPESAGTGAALRWAAPAAAFVLASAIVVGRALRKRR